jgi:Lar family restriction alleviation protein
MTSELKPCPFCGCRNVYPVGPSLGHSSWRVFCDDCHAEGPSIPSYNSDEGEDRCQWVWNIRLYEARAAIAGDSHD